MSRVGKRPVAVPSGVTATVDGQTVKMKGPKGQLQFVVHDDVEVKLADGAIKVAPRVETNRAQALYGTARAQIANRDDLMRPAGKIQRSPDQFDRDHRTVGVMQIGLDRLVRIGRDPGERDLVRKAGCEAAADELI